MNFKLSGATRELLANPSVYRIKSKKLDLEPRNIYLRSGRIMKQKEVSGYLDKIGKESYWTRIKDWCKNIFK